jgi:hypothetical protein
MHGGNPANSLSETHQRHGPIAVLDKVDGAFGPVIRLARLMLAFWFVKYDADQISDMLW